jgi:hypothetical protein
MTKDDLSGADIKAVCTEAGLLALRERRMRVNKADFTAAREKVGALLFLLDCVLNVSRRFRFCTGRMRVHPKVYTCSLHSSYSLLVIILTGEDGAAPESCDLVFQSSHLQKTNTNALQHVFTKTIAGLENNIAVIMGGYNLLSGSELRSNRDRS